VKSVEKFMRGIQAEAAEIIGSLSLMGEPSLSHDDLSKVDDAVKVLGDAITILADHAKQAKARAERIQWVYCGDRTMVARYKGSTYRYSGVHRQVDADTKSGWVCLFPATSIESANRKIRAWRKKQ
jgi:hypothetical protein